MNTHRVILANDSRLLRGMLRRAINKAPGLEVVDEASGTAMLLSLLERRHTHWAIVSLRPDGRMPDVAQRILCKHASVGVLAVASDGSLAKVKRVASGVKTLDDLRLRKLISVLIENGGTDEADSEHDL